MGKHRADGTQEVDKADEDSGTFSGDLNTRPSRPANTARTFESDDAGVEGFEYF